MSFSSACSYHAACVNVFNEKGEKAIENYGLESRKAMLKGARR